MYANEKFHMKCMKRKLLATLYDINVLCSRRVSYLHKGFGWYPSWMGSCHTTPAVPLAGVHRLLKHRPAPLRGSLNDDILEQTKHSTHENWKLIIGST